MRAALVHRPRCAMRDAAPPLHHYSRRAGRGPHPPPRARPAGPCRDVSAHRPRGRGGGADLTARPPEAIGGRGEGACGLAMLNNGRAAGRGAVRELDSAVPNVGSDGAVNSAPRDKLLHRGGGCAPRSAAPQEAAGPTLQPRPTAGPADFLAQCPAPISLVPYAEGTEVSAAGGTEIHSSFFNCFP